MADITGRFQTEAIDRALAACQRAVRGGDAELMEKIGLALVTGATQRLGGTEGPAAPWPGLNPAYAALRKERYPAAEGMLLASGQLSRSLTYEVNGLQVKAGSPLVYAGVHQAGATIRAVNAPALAFQLMGEEGRPVWHHVQSVRIPARPYLGIGSYERGEIMHQVSLAFSRAFEQGY